MNRGVVSYIVLGVALLLLAACAKKGRPTGGPKDEDAPVMVMAKPPHYTVNFDKKEIKIFFDEFIKLEKVTEQLVVSPPLSYQPIIKPLGTASKFISIKLLDTLKPNTTYSLNFGESVIDNNEKNVLHNFKYVFSTGPVIDSLKIGGTVRDGYELETEPYTTVMLYAVNETYADSIIYTEKPLYVGSTLDSTHWEISNIKAGTYALVALKDRSKNYLYDPSVDKIGFYDKVITIPGDTVFNLTLFKEQMPFKIIRPFEVVKGHIQIGFQGDANGLQLAVLNPSTNFASITALEQGKDTLNFWHKGIQDSIVLRAQQGDYIDTLTVALRTKKIDSLSIANRSGNVLHPKDTLRLAGSNPIVHVDTTKITLLNTDSLAIAYSVQLDKKNIVVDFERKEAETYRFKALPGAFTDFFGEVNDTINLKFTTKEKEDYGQVQLTFTQLETMPLLVDLLNSKGETVRSTYIDQVRKFNFVDLLPDTYSLRIIFDENRNKQWDTGSYLDKRTPEKVVYYAIEVPVKANWDVKESIALE